VVEYVDGSNYFEEIRSAREMIQLLLGFSWLLAGVHCVVAAATVT